jgi:hypothetical protein
MCILPSATPAVAPTPAAALCPAKLLKPEQRQDLAVQALGGTDTITALAEQAGVSRKFVYQQIDCAQQALAEAFAAPADDGAVLCQLPVTRKWLRQQVLSLLLNCRSSYRGVIRHFRDCVGWPIALGTIHNIVQDAVARARARTAQVSLAAIDVGLLDEIFQAGLPVLVGVDAASSYCFLLSQEGNREGVTWGVRLLELQDRGLAPDAFVADFATGLRAGCGLAFAHTPCWGDVFHGLQEVGAVVSALEKHAYAALAARDHLAHQAARHQHRHGRANLSLIARLALATAKAEQAIALADDVAILADWLREEVFALAGPAGADRRALYDFIVAELRDRAAHGAHGLTPLCTFLDNQRDHLLGFAAQLDRDLAGLAARAHVPVVTCRALLRLQHLSYANPRRWHGEAELRQQLHGRFHDLDKAVRQLAQRTVRASSLVENLNSRLRNYFTLRRHLGADYLALLQFFLNHRRLDRSDCPARAGKSPTELLTGQTHPHWLALLGYQPFSQN